MRDIHIRQADVFVSGAPDSRQPLHTFFVLFWNSTFSLCVFKDLGENKYSATPRSPCPAPVFALCCHAGKNVH
jgi:hypothetical protein